MRRALAVSAVALWLASCAGPAADGDVGRPDPSGAAAPADPDAGAGPWHAVTSAAGNWVVHWRALPGPVPLDDRFDLELRLEGADGAAPPDELVLAVDAGMPQHQHGMLQRCGLTRTGRDTWRADGLRFHMGGAWTVVFDLTVGPLTERAEAVVVLDG